MRDGPGQRRKERLDDALVRRGLAPDAARARALILAGRVRSGESRLDKPGAWVDAASPIHVEGGPRRVGRGAGKLGPALAAFGVDPAGRDALDVGASTGGFTQVLLERGATRVAALDVGRGLLDWELRNDPRVTSLEGVNARYLTVDVLPFVPSLAVVDVSFISLEQVLPPVAACLGPGGEIVALVKPQFEARRGEVERGGVVRDPEIHREVLRRIAAFAGAAGLGPGAISRSALRGARGNLEFFLHLRPGRPEADGAALAAAIDRAAGGDER